MSCIPGWLFYLAFFGVAIVSGTLGFLGAAILVAGRDPDVRAQAFQDMEDHFGDPPAR